MFIIDRMKKNRIILTKGDTATFLVSAMDLLGNEYEIQENDVVRFSVRKTPLSEAVIELTATPDHYFIINPEDTKNLEAGLYLYDVDLTMSNGSVYTIIPLSYFELQEEMSR